MAEYRNPQQEPGGDRRMLLIFAVTFALIIIGQIFLSKERNKQAPGKSSASPVTQGSNPPASQPANEAASALPATVAEAAAGTPGKNAAKQPVAAKVAAAESFVTVENDVYRLTFTNRGAQVKSWVLKKFKDDAGRPLDLVNPYSVNLGLPLGLYTYNESLRNQVNSALYTGGASGSITAPGELTYEYAAGDVTVRKSFHSDATYVITVETEVTQNGNRVQAFPSWPDAFGDQVSAPAFAAEKIAYMANGKVERIAAKKVSNGNTIRGPFNWAGVQDQFFAAIVLPDNPETAAMVTLHTTIAVPKDSKNPDPNNVNHYDVLGTAVGDTTGQTLERVFVGPKALNVLESVRSNTAPGKQDGPDLRNLVDFGYFSLIARPLFLWLKWMHEHIVSNWGWAIIILTVIINLALLPLRITSMKSALKMQKLQPQMKAIQERYKKYPLRDPKRQEMNTEIGELYKREGVNPAGGCVPLIIQMPFLWAIYSMLGNAIELRQAPFLWLHDLSSPDKLFIIPVVMVISTYLMQKMTPNSGMDPKQQQMMALMMPLMIGWFSVNMPSGLSVYWIIGNVIGIGQQYIMNKTGLGREMREEMEKRARKKALK